MFGPISLLYQERIQSGELQEDTSQQALVEALDQLYLDIHAPFYKRFFSPQIKGLYISGDVGRGKTYLMDLFFSETKVTKQRLHFLVFKKLLFQTLQLQHSNKWENLAKHFIKQGAVLCLDEFQIQDIGDLRILETFFKFFFQHGGILITTSNYTPEAFSFSKRINETSFVAFLKHHLTFIFLENGPDYRIRGKENCERFFVDQPFRSIANFFKKSLRKTYRECTYTFHTLCETAVGAAHYEKVAQQCDVVIITHCHQLTDNHENSLLRFIHLIDLLYDNKVRLFIYADVNLKDLYVGQKHANIFKRTLSRLLELTSR